MKFDIPFKSEIYLNQTQLIIPMIYRHYFKDARESLIVGLISTSLGISIIIGKSYLGIVFIALGTWFIIKSYPKFKLYNTLKKTHLKLTKEKLSESESDFGNGIFEFTENSLKYIDKLQTRDIEWTEFKDFKIVESNLLLILDQEKGDIMAIGENEIGIENFVKIIDFVKTKLK
ncbi:hypothetical protein [Psychroserpens sp.]|uniref:hypothetical protein n=1 Tax=Psychroserpens sp. TaxID=2020870 RepID=UPI003C787F4A